MTTTVARIGGAEGPDRLAGAVLSMLQRRRNQGRIGGALREGVAAVLTFGLWPAIRWPWRLRDVVALERNQYWHLYEWLRLEGGYGTDVLAPLERAVERIEFRTSLWLAGLIALSLVAAYFGWTGAQLGMGLADFVRATYRHGAGARGQVGGGLYPVWLAGLGAAYALHWVQVQLHARDVRRVVEAWNGITQREGLEAVRLGRIGVGVSLGWLVAGGVLCWMGLWWAAPMAVAGAAHQRLVGTVVPRLRQELAEAMRIMLLIRRPGGRTPMISGGMRRCGNPRCGARMPPAANFCPRCGTRVDGRV